MKTAWRQLISGAAVAVFAAALALPAHAWLFDSPTPEQEPDEELALLMEGALKINLSNTFADGEGYTLEGKSLTLTEEGGVYHITGWSYSNSVKVDDEVSALTVILEDASINSERHAFDVNSAVVTVVLAGENLLFGEGDSAGLHVPMGGAVRITGGGSLFAYSELGAGIGGAYEDALAGDIHIDGAIIQAYSYMGAGIGGGRYGNASLITIDGGSSVSTYSLRGAGIGGGAKGSGGLVVIGGGSEVDTISDSGAGIGGGQYGAGGFVIIEDASSVNATSSSGYDIGSGEGFPRSSGRLQVEGSTLTLGGNGTDAAEEYIDTLLTNYGMGEESGFYPREPADDEEVDRGKTLIRYQTGLRFLLFVGILLFLLLAGILLWKLVLPKKAALLLRGKD